MREELLPACPNGMGLAKAVQGLREGVWEGVAAWRQNRRRVRGGEKKEKKAKKKLYIVLKPDPQSEVAQR